MFIQKVVSTFWHEVDERIEAPAAILFLLSENLHR